MVSKGLSFENSNKFCYISTLEREKVAVSMATLKYDNLDTISQIIVFVCF